jgi:ribosomal protein L11 methylase PrmA
MMIRQKPVAGAMTMTVTAASCSHGGNLQLSERQQELLSRLSTVEIPLGETIVELYALPETSFREATACSNADHVFDGTGTRPWSGCMAFLQFAHAFPEIFKSADINVLELGCGIGVCGLLLAKHHEAASVVMTDGEPMALEIAKKNRQRLGVKKNAQVQRLLWDVDSSKIMDQLLGRQQQSFDYVVGSDLFYYKTDAQALFATIASTCQTAAFLPGIVRSQAQLHQISELAEMYGFTVKMLTMSRFITEKHMDVIVGWYNIRFFVLLKKGARIPHELLSAMEKAGQRPFDPDLSDDDYEEY